MKSIFLEKSYTKCCGKTRPFSKKSKLNISLDQYSKVLYSFLFFFFFFLYSKLRAIEILKLRCTPLAFSSYIVFLINKKRSRASPRLIFCMSFEEKYLCCYIPLPAFTSCKILRNMCNVIVC